MTQRISYKEAVEFPEVRQQYVANIPLEWARKYIARVFYAPILENTRLMASQEKPLPALLGLRGYRSTAYVFTDAFTLEEQDFKSVLLDYVGHFARDTFYEPKFIDPVLQGKRMAHENIYNLFTDKIQIEEQLNIHSKKLRAYRFQLQQIQSGNRIVSDHLLKCLEEQILLQSDAIDIAQEAHAQQSTNVHYSLISKLIK